MSTFEDVLCLRRWTCGGIEVVPFRVGCGAVETVFPMNVDADKSVHSTGTVAAFRIPEWDSTGVSHVSQKTRNMGHPIS
jgi:hypothetical protein